MSSRMANCIFCKIIRGEIPLPHKLFESDRTIAFLDINPVSWGHLLVVPKFHGEKLADVPDDQLSEVLPVIKKMVVATGVKDYNILQNNGTIAHQQVPHVHFHMIPKPNEEEGLVVGWPLKDTAPGDLQQVFEAIKTKM